MRILSVCAEFAPLAKVGGLGDVTAGLAAWLSGRGHDVAVVLPYYGAIREQGFSCAPEPVLAGRRFRTPDFTCEWSVVPLLRSGPGPAVYLIDCPALFSGEVYQEGPQEALRFLLLSRAALEFAAAIGFSPDIVHVHDWHAAPAAVMLDGPLRTERALRRASSVLTIHNIGYQGVFGSAVIDGCVDVLPRNLLAPVDIGHGQVNFLRAGIMRADALTTVSPTHAQEIQTAAYGKGLDELLRQRRHRLTGILNGVDYSQWSPEIDALLPQRYDAADLRGKQAVRAALAAELGLQIDAATPVAGLVSRLTEQKGIDLLIAALPAMLARRPLACALLGSGDPYQVAALRALARAHPGRVAFVDGQRETLAHRIIAGSDLLLVPSRYEPCGLTQLYAMRYGTVPLVRRTGGLADTVTHFDPVTGTGTGCVFLDADVGGVTWALDTALDWYANRQGWAQLVRNGMRANYSWERQGPHYEALFSRLVAGSDAA